jgi:hypothetical protein
MFEIRLDGRTMAWSSATLRRTYLDAIPRRMRHADLSGNEVG